MPSTEALGYVWILNGAAHGADVPIDVREGERVEITGTGEKPKLSGIVQLVADAQKSKSRAQHLANRAARLLTVVVIACPHPFGLAVPLVWSDPRDIPRIITLSSATYRKMVQNLCWAAGYNIFAIPLATGALAPWGILCIPTVGAVLMSASTVAVAINAQLLKRVRR